MDTNEQKKQPLYGELPEIQVEGGAAIQGFPVQIDAPFKTAVLRLPKPAEMMEWLSKQRSLVTDLGNGCSQSEPVPSQAADLVLFKKIRIDDGAEFDEFEAEYAIEQLTKQKVTACEREGNTYRVTLRTRFGFTVHVLGIPSRKDIAFYRRGVYKGINRGHGVEERRYPPEAAALIYDPNIKSVEGYVDAIAKDPQNQIPPNHKNAVVLELLQALDGKDPAFDPNF